MRFCRLIYEVVWSAHDKVAERVDRARRGSKMQPARHDNSIEDIAHTARCTSLPYKGARMCRRLVSHRFCLVLCTFRWLSFSFLHFFSPCIFGKRFINVASINKQTDVRGKKIRPPEGWKSGIKN